MHDLAVGYPHEGGEALIAGMKVRRRMIVMIHPDDDTEEDRDYRHSAEAAAQADKRQLCRREQWALDPQVALMANWGRGEALEPMELIPGADVDDD